ncbi:MAG: pyridoxamine kinase [Eubacteriales bacterium]|nr:pyridoxamine kinase [Eubacteriales bacterium]
MDYKRILTIQDISCVGQCSLTVALPILSACGLETAILPSAVLSTHSVGFQDFTCHDLTEDIPAIEHHWQKEGIRFEAVYTGYLGSGEQIDMVKDIFTHLLVPGGKKIVDPAMADSGKLYPAFDMDFVQVMKSLVAEADIILPNITEAALLTGSEYRTEYDEAYIDGLVEGLHRLGAGTVVITGVSYNKESTGVLVSENGKKTYYTHELLDRGCHGTGDVFASSFVGAYMHGKSAPEAAQIAADYTLSCIKNTIDDPDHWYGVKFEPVLGELIKALE